MIGLFYIKVFWTHILDAIMQIAVGDFGDYEGHNALSEIHIA